MLILWAEFWIFKDSWNRISHLRRLIQNNPIMRLSQKYLENRYDIAEQKEPNPKLFVQEQRIEVRSNVPQIQGSGSELKWKGSET